MDLRKLIPKDISERKRASLNILNRDVGVLRGEQRMSVSTEMRGWISMGICLADRKGAVRKKHIDGNCRNGW